MIVQCKKNKDNSSPLVLPRFLSHEIGNENFVASSEWFTINAEISGYSITKGKKYDVFGILKFNNQTRFLIIDDTRTPGFFPSNLFVVINHDIDSNWETSEYRVRNASLLIISYPALAKSYNDLVSLIDCTDSAVYAFWNYVAKSESASFF